MTVSPQQLEGRKLCVVFVKVTDPQSQKVSLQCLRGRASVTNGRIACVADDGTLFQIPSSAARNILPSDGTPLLKDADYFVLVKVDPSIKLVSKGDDDLEIHDLPDDDDGCDCGCGHHHHHS